MFLMLVFCSILVASVSRTYFFLFLGISVLFDFIATLIAKMGLSHRIKRYDYMNEANRYMTKFIMSKNEIFQNNKAEVEASRIGETIHLSFTE
jgi:hypothetical protein